MPLLLNIIRACQISFAVAHGNCPSKPIPQHLHNLDSHGRHLVIMPSCVIRTSEALVFLMTTILITSSLSLIGKRHLRTFSLEYKSCKMFHGASTMLPKTCCYFILNIA